MSELTPENRALCDENPVEKLRKCMFRTYTPSSEAILSMMRWAVEDVVMAEEYDHPVLSKEEALKRATAQLALVQRAYKQSVLTEIKCRKGEWLAMA
jgi:hypothetical protein